MAVDVLVTGGSGVFGRQIVSSLRMRNYNVVACGRTAGEKVDATWDISQQEAPAPDCKPSTVVHAAALIGHYHQPLSEANTLLNVNVTGTLRVANWCVMRGVEQLVLVSGAIVYGKWNGTPKSEADAVKPWLAGAYAISKWGSEQVADMVTKAGCRLAILRLSSLYGIGYNKGLIQKILLEGRHSGTIDIKPPFDDAFDLLHVSDAVQAVERVIENNQTGLWNIGSGKLTTIQELAEVCARQLNAKVALSDTESMRPSRIINWVEDRKARSELGHANQVALNMGVSQIAQALLTI